MGLASSINGLSLSNITNIAQQYIVAPIASFGLGGFVFNVQGESIAHLSADITDHYTESNQALQDHIAIKPKRITLKGYVGELVYNKQTQSTTVINNVAQKLTVISSYLPQISSGAQQLQSTFNGNTAPDVGSILSSTSNIYGLVKNVLGAFGDMANQQNAYTYFKSLMESATLMGVQTPWEFMSNMAIESITAIQDEKTQFVTDFSVSYKQIRIATTQTIAFSAGGTGGVVPTGGLTQQGATAIQAENPVNLGTNPCQTTPVASLPGVNAPLKAGDSFAPGTPVSNLFNMAP